MLRKALAGFELHSEPVLIYLRLSYLFVLLHLKGQSNEKANCGHQNGFLDNQDKKINGH
jgi:hypothetical protein